MPSCISAIRVRYAETDQMGVVHHAAYLPWFEVARTEYLRSRGLSYRQMEERGIRLPVLAVAARYHAPALYDDLLEVEADLVQATPVRFAFEYRVRRRGEIPLLCQARTDHAAVDFRGRPHRISKELLTLLGGPLE